LVLLQSGLLVRVIMLLPVCRDFLSVGWGIWGACNRVLISFRIKNFPRRIGLILRLIFEFRSLFRRILNTIIKFWVRPLPRSLGVTDGVTTQFLSWNIMWHTKVPKTPYFYNAYVPRYLGRHIWTLDWFYLQSLPSWVRAETSQKQV
jgi:hypothetical protein